MNELPVGLRVEHTVVQGNVNGAALVLGQERVLIGEPENGRIPLEPRIDWVLVLQMPPACLKRLSRQMAEIVANYETNFGTIPEDLPKPAKAALSLVTPSSPQEAPPLKDETFQYSGHVYRRPVKAEFESLLRDAYDRADPSTRRQPLREYPPGEPWPSQLGQIPLSGPLSRQGAQTACDQETPPSPSSDRQNPGPSPEADQTAQGDSEEHL